MPISVRADARIAAALDFLVANANRYVTVRQMAAAAGLSPARFSHIFALRAGMTPGELLRLRRQLRAKEQLAKELLSAYGDRGRF